MSPADQPNCFASTESTTVNRFNLSPVLLAIVAACSTGVNAAEDNHTDGPYIGGSLGRTSFSARTPGLPTVASDEVALAGKVYGGWHLNEHFGVEAGYVRFGSLAESVSVGGDTVEQGARGRSLYAALTGRVPLTSSLALTGKAGVSFGKVSGNDVLPASAQLVGSQRSLMYGVGAEYRLSPQIALTADFEHFGKLSDNARASVMSAGMRYDF